MGRSGHIADIRSHIGTRLLLMPAAAAAVFDAERRLLLLRHVHDGTWGLPGGAMEPEETPADAASRELREEAGLDLRPEAIIGVCGGTGHVVSYPNGDRTAYVTTLFAFQLDDQQVTPDGTEVDRARWLPLDDTPELTMDSSTVELVTTVRSWLSAAPTGRPARFRH